MPRKNQFISRLSIRSAWKRKGLLALGSAACAAFLWSAIVGEMGVIKYYRMSSQERSLRKEIALLEQDNLRLGEEVRSLKYDAAYIERLARDTIGLARPGEIVYYYGDTDRP